MIIYISGACGVWKSSIAHGMAGLMRKVPRFDSSVLYNQYAHEFFWYPKINYYKDWTERHKLPIFQSAIPFYIPQDQWTIITWHWFLTEEESNMIKFYILVEANFQDIHERVLLDHNRQLSNNPRYYASLADIRDEVLEHRSRFNSFTHTTNKLTIINHKLSSAIKECIDAIKKFYPNLVCANV